MPDPDEVLAPGRPSDQVGPMSDPVCQHPAHAHSAADLREAVRAVGLRATGARIAVLACLRQAARPLSHAEVMDGLDEHRAWDRATVYRNLSDLSKAGLLHRYDLGDHVWRFELVGDPCTTQDDEEHGHPHFLCTKCGEVQCLDGLELSLPAQAGLPSALRSKSVEVQVRGVCDDCV